MVNIQEILVVSDGIVPSNTLGKVLGLRHNLLKICLGKLINLLIEILVIIPFCSLNDWVLGLRHNMPHQKGCRHKMCLLLAFWLPSRRQRCLITSHA